MGDISDIRVAPDGAIFDRVAEFVFAKNPEQARTLFAADPNGYTDALGKFVQTLAASEKLVGGAKLGVTSAAIILKEHLTKAGRLDYSEFFNPEPTAQQERLAAARAWLLGYWECICEELAQPDSAAPTAITGHLKREAYYRWVLQHSAWFERLAIPDEEVMQLPIGILNRLARTVGEFLADNGVLIEADQIKPWVQQNVTIHFRNFAEYWKFVGETNWRRVHASLHPVEPRIPAGDALASPINRSSCDAFRWPARVQKGEESMGVGGKSSRVG